MKKKANLRYSGLIWLSLTLSVSLMAQQSPRERVYNALITDQMDDWHRVIEEQKSQKKSLSDEQLGELINFYYGYTGWLLEEGTKKEAKNYIEECDEIIDELMVKYPDKSDLYAYKAAFYAYKLNLNPIKAPFLGGKSMDNIDLALEKCPGCPHGWIEKGNSLFYMPKAFGGSKPEAIEAYKKAILYMESEPAYLIHNWVYLNVLMVLAQAYEKTENFDMAKKSYEKILRVEPNFTYIRDEVFPPFMNEYNERQKSGKNED